MKEKELKKCTVCGEEKEESIEFFALRKDTGKFRNKCKSCKNVKTVKEKPNDKYTEDGIKIKKCIGECGEEKPEIIENFIFYKNTNKFDSKCRVCINKIRKERHRQKVGYTEPIIKYNDNGLLIKVCSGCGEEKTETDEFFKFVKNTKRFSAKCIFCVSKQRKEFRENNKEKISERGNIYYLNNKEYIQEYKKEYRKNNAEMINEKYKIYYEENKEDLLLYQKEYREEHKEELSEQKKVYYKENKESIRKTKNIWYNNKIKTDPIFRFMKIISSRIRDMLNSQGNSKNGVSSKLKVPFTGEQLFNHIVSKFSDEENLTLDGEVWMTIYNQGIYNSETWDEKDSSTWVWHIDHIIPQSKLKFDSYDHPNFLKCWALENLRPLSGKKNINDGNRR